MLSPPIESQSRDVPITSSNQARLVEVQTMPNAPRAGAVTARPSRAPRYFGHFHGRQSERVASAGMQLPSASEVM
jgi:hypothetical protein